MKDFLLKVAMFIILIGSITIGLILLSDFAVKKRKPELLQISNKIDMVFSGDSHVECSVNDNLIANSINIAQSGEAYLYSYAKIKSLLEYNDQISTIYIGYSYGDLLKDKETRWLFGDASVTEFIKNYNYLLDGSDRSIIFQANSKAYLRGLVKSAFRNFQTFGRSFSEDPDKRKIINYGGYLYLVRDKLQEDKDMVDTYRDEPLVISQIQEEYLKMLSQLCQEKSVKLVLLNTPKYLYYNLNVNREIRQNWISFRQTMPEDSLLDLSSISLPDSCYGDMTHLNYKGAELFSQYLNELLH